MTLASVQQVVFPWPAKVLSPNNRSHWRQRSKAAKAYRMQCFLFAKKAGLVAPPGRILLQLEFLPPDLRRRDDDNLVAAFKSGRDGLADALGVDDRLFISQARLGETVHPGGAVRVTLSAYRGEVALG